MDKMWPWLEDGAPGKGGEAGGPTGAGRTTMTMAAEATETVATWMADASRVRTEFRTVKSSSPSAVSPTAIAITCTHSQHSFSMEQVNSEHIVATDKFGRSAVHARLVLCYMCKADAKFRREKQ